MKCPKCQHENPGDSTFCGKCGTHITPHPEVPPLVTETLETSQEELTTGSVFAGRYQVIEELGKGGMGKVYRVLDKKLNEEVALKLIKPEIASDKNTLERFKNELKLARKVVQKNVGRMFDIGEETGTHYITMEYVPGEDLKSFIRRSGQLAVGTTIRIAKQICEGLSEAHSIGIVHRDLKPSNIMIDKVGHARIMDFGIARSLKGKGITGAGAIIGTPEYMSPEQVDGKDADQMSDIYSFGIILYEMLTGRLPFEGETPLSIAVQHRSDTPKDPKEFNAQIPDDLDRIILKCLEKKPEDRYQATSEVYSELIMVEQGLPTTEKVVFRTKTTTSKQITVSISPKIIMIPSLAFLAISIIGLVVIKPWNKTHSVPIASENVSIAVLPFVDYSPEKDHDHLCVGITFEIITKLSGLKDWKVMNTASVMQLKDTKKDIKEIGQELNVNTILFGSVRKEGKDIRIDVQLVNVEDRFQIWSKTYQTRMDRVFEIQSDVALRIADALLVELTTDEKNKIRGRGPENLEAYDLYLIGGFFWSKGGKENYDKSIDYFKRAIDVDPSYAIAYAGMSDSYISYAFNGYSPRKAVIPQAKTAAIKALEIDDTLSEAHASLAFARILGDWEWMEGERGLKRAIELNPGYASAHYYYSWLLTFIEKHDQAITEAKIALELDPLSVGYHVSLGRRYHYARRYDEAIKEYRKVQEFSPTSAHEWVAMAFIQKGMYEEAVKEIMDTTEEMSWYRGYVYGATGKRDEALKVLNALLEREKQEFIWPATIAFLYIGLGDTERALERLEKTYEEREAWLDLLKVAPIYDSLRSKKRYKDLLQRMNFPD